ncbi:2Fe-2S iron-sulfur cluster-binding protein [Corallococcus sp. AS-1-6]|uniref:2Fe-2S iron-sulfur cluster-binding protein n=1 Tax=Corallococcus sp. AS-1-6 TaxID=2874599 RepID=UPI001CBF4A53|nr:2Fe-2S iron-sulfur cluster-binding protein [Corallococcus sp. AS-1-6]MBZ4376953.1 (2Fe-2S)-binding protein [Corallococcus sp. AS-1-6]
MRRLPDATPRGRAITVDLEGESIPAIEGEPVACSLIAAGENVLSRSVKYHRPRGPYCFAAACSHCLMRVDGLPNVYTCRTPAKEGMRLERQNAYPSAKVDIFETIDWFFPKRLDHHEMFAGVPVAEDVMARVARQLAGLGLLPKEAGPAPLPPRTSHTSVAVVGGGAAGLEAARVLAGQGVPFLLFERDANLGGRLAHGAPEDGAPFVPEATAFPQGSVVRDATVIGLYDDEHGRYLAVAAREAANLRLLKVYAKRFLLTVGGHPPTLPFENNDLPGVLAGRAASLLLRKHDVAPQVAALVGHGPELHALAHLFTQRGVEVAAVVDLKGPLPANAHPKAVVGDGLKAHGLRGVTALSFTPQGGRKQKVSCDAVVVSVPVAPGFELARQGGAKVEFDADAGHFRVEADADGRTQAADVFVAGDVAKPGTAKDAAAMGARAARALLGGLS